MHVSYPPGYTAHDLERVVADPSSSGRPEFERDRARIVHSAALRRLAAKTQVVGPASNDFVRNRLTHTLEVAQVGRDLAHTVGCDPDVVETACLAHDLGHPPFGHNGERALNEASLDIGGFEGNAQTLRLLTRLEPRAVADDGRPLGLNLTRTCLDASTKYPWPVSEARPPRGRHADGLPRTVRKFGVYDNDLPVFAWMRAEAPGRRLCVEAQVMDFADDVAYSVHDVEDGVVAGRVDLAALADRGLRDDVHATTRSWYASDMPREAFEEAYERLSALSVWPTTTYDGSRPHQAGLKQLTSRLIGRFCLSLRDALEPGHAPLTRYAADLPQPQHTDDEIALLKGVVAHLVMRSDERVNALRTQRELLTELVEGLLEHPAALMSAFADDFAAATDDAARRRVVIDQVASLTDRSAVLLHDHVRR